MSGERKKAVQRYAKMLRTNVPRSELWFYELYKKHKDKDDRTNVPFCGFIPDLINRTYKYIIEIDGSMHDRPEVQARDKLKDSRFQQQGYRVFRIKGYDEASFNVAMASLLPFRRKKETAIWKSKDI